MSDDRRGGVPDPLKQADRTGHPISVCAVSSFYWPDFSGAAVQAQRLYRALAGDEFQFTVLAARRAQGATRPRTELVERVRVHRLSVLSPLRSSFSRVGAFSKILCDLSFSVACAWWILKARRKIDLLHIHAAFLPPLVLLARMLRIPVIIKQTMLGPRPSSFGARLQHRALTRADKLITLSRTMAAQYSGMDAKRLEIIPQGVDASLFAPVSSERKKALREFLALDPNGLFIVFVGAIQHRKGVDILVRAFIETAAQCPRLGMVLIGERDFRGRVAEQVLQRRRQYRGSLETALREHGLADRVRWTGRLSPDEVLPYLQAADLFCLPSRREGVPSAPLEAMACGLPVIVSSLDGTSEELLTNGREGFIIDNEEASNYSRCIEALASNADLARRMSRLGRRRIEEAFSFQQAAERYRLLFRSLARTDR